MFLLKVNIGFAVKLALSRCSITDTNWVSSLVGSYSLEANVCRRVCSPVVETIKTVTNCTCGYTICKKDSLNDLALFRDPLT